MKMSRELTITKRIFTINNIKQIAEIFERQKKLDNSSDRNEVRFAIYFDDKTSFESDSQKIFDDTSIINAKRPIKVEFNFSNYSLERRMYFTIEHGNSEYNNKLIITGDGKDWVNDNFITIKELIEVATPQKCLIRKHIIILISLIALGMGSIVAIIINLIIDCLSIAPINVANSSYRIFQFLHEISSSHKNLFYVLGWVNRWLIGIMLGAVPVSKWLLDAWPIVELDFGAEHLKKEKARRKRIWAIISLVIIPIILTIFIDIINAYFIK